LPFHILRSNIKKPASAGFFINVKDQDTEQGGRGMTENTLSRGPAGFEACPVSFGVVLVGFATIGAFEINPAA
jgi:hypothetical protein